MQAPQKKRQSDFIPRSSQPLPNNKKLRAADVKPRGTLDSIVDEVFALPSLQHVKLEFRVGKISEDGRKFISGLSEDDFRSLCAHVKKASKFQSQREYIYDQGRSSSTLLSCDESGLVTEAFCKERLSVFDMATNLPFDLRIALSKETPITPLPASIEEGYIKHRTKARFSIDTKDWVLELIDIISDGEKKNYEMEVSVKMTSLAACADHKACVSLLSSVFSEVHIMLSKLDGTVAQLFPDLRLERIIDRELRTFLKREFAQLFPGVPSLDRFAGSTPTGLERSKIKVIQTGNYWVSEKSDGIRLMLFLIDSTAYFVDRKMDFFQIHKFTFIVDLYGRKGVSLLDGEMVRHMRTGRLMFLVFDVLALNGRENLGAYSLLDRLNIVTQAIESFRSACLACKMKDDSSRLQFSLAGKIFRNKAGLKLLTDMIKTQENGDRLFIDERRCHRNDGLIFTLDGPYLPYNSSHLMKWKYCDRLTIDFRLKLLEDGGFQVLVGTGRNREQEMIGFEIMGEDWDRLRADMAKSMNPKEAIIECAYNAPRHQWTYLNLRPDKNIPNHINTMDHTVRLVSESITMEELVYRVPLTNPALDDWERLHPELVKAPCLSEPSPTSFVDLPSTPVPSPIACVKSPPQSLHSPSPTSRVPPTPPIHTYKPSSQSRSHRNQHNKPTTNNNGNNAHAKTSTAAIPLFSQCHSLVNNHPATTITSTTSTTEYYTLQNPDSFPPHPLTSLSTFESSLFTDDHQPTIDPPTFDNNLSSLPPSPPSPLSSSQSDDSLDLLLDNLSPPTSPSAFFS